MPDRPLLDIVIVNWNSGAQLAECVTALLASDARGFAIDRLVVVDNASRDGSADLDERRPPLTVLCNEQNIGFGAACNQGTGNSRADYFLFMNPDAIVRPDTLGTVVSFMESTEAADVGILGPRMVDAAGRTQRCCARFPSPGAMAARSAGLDLLFPRAFPPHFLVEFDHASSRAVDQVMGAFFLMRAPLFRSLGGFDRRFFLYWEDVDLSLRAKQAGWSTYYLASAEVFHAGGGTTDSIRPTRLAYSLRSRLAYARKHFTMPGALMVTASALAVEPLARTAQCLVRRDLSGAKDVAGGYRLLLKGR